jgi:hypothetical protein
MNDTPLTDAVLTNPERDGNDLPDLARTLERELAEARKAIAGILVLADLYFERDGRDPYNNDNYCRAKDWMNAHPAIDAVMEDKP